MKSLIQLCGKILADCEALCCVSTIRDFKRISDRVEHEGISFLTITLPNICKDFESCLSNGSVSSSSFIGFKRPKNGRLPLFLGGFFKLVFDPLTGKILDNPDINAIYSIRQVLLAFKKFRADCTPRRVRSTLDQYVMTDFEIGEHFENVNDYVIDAFVECSRVLFGPIFNKLNRDLMDDPNIVIPRHGSGTTASRVLSNRKYDHLDWTYRLEKHFRASNFLLPSWNAEDRFLEINFKTLEQEEPVRVVTVPKTLKTPRIIAIEPVCMQYVQQGLMELIVPLLESRKLYNSIGFLDQKINQDLACKGSHDGSIATMDLSEASDRVHNHLVEALLSPWPTLSDMVQACRSKQADVPGYGIHTLFKFASMGSALCFPIEAMVFLTIAFLSQTKELSYQTMKKRRVSFLRSVRIYGDDIIVPVGMAHSVACELSTFGLKVNKHKTFWTGKFRESCGGDFYDGVPVNPVYIKASIPTSRRPAQDVESTIAMRNLFYKGGMWRVAAYVDDCVKRFAPLPVVLPTSPVLGRHSFLGFETQKLCPHLHRPMVKGMIPRRIKPLSPLDGYGALLKFFLKRSKDPFHEVSHLKRDGRPKVATINLRWAVSI